MPNAISKPAPSKIIALSRLHFASSYEKPVLTNVALINAITSSIINSLFDLIMLAALLYFPKLLTFDPTLIALVLVVR